MKRREYKFRAWDKDNKVMIIHEDDNTLMIPCSLGVLWLNPSIKDNNYVIMKKRFNLMQYIGRKDKNGVESYHKDIIEFIVTGIDTHLEILTGVIEWDESIASFYIRVITKDTEQKPNWRMDSVKFTIIGNIHENPELL